MLTVIIFGIYNFISFKKEKMSSLWVLHKLLVFYNGKILIFFSLNIQLNNLNIL